MNVLLATGPRKRGEFHCQCLKIITQMLCAPRGLQALLEDRVLRRNAHRAATRMTMVASAWRGAQRCIVSTSVDRATVVKPDIPVATQGHQGALPNRDRISPHRKRLRHIRASSDTARHDQLHLADHVEVLQCGHRLTDCSKGWDPDVLDKTGLGGGRSALHPVDHDDIGPRMHCELDVVEDTGRTDLDVDWLLPVGHLAIFANLDGQIIGSSPVRMAGGRTLIDALREGSHRSHSRVDFLTQQHPTTAWLGTLTNHHLDRIGSAQIIGVKTVSRWQTLVDQGLRGISLLVGHPAVARGGRCAHLRGRPTNRLLDVR